VEVSTVTETKMYQLRSLPLHVEWSLLHHLRRMSGFGDHSRVKARKSHVAMILQ
jgi:hypothetical protein